MKKKLAFIFSFLFLTLFYYSFLHFSNDNQTEEHEVFFLPSKIPCISVNINNSSVWMSLDLGSNKNMTLQRASIENLNLKSAGIGHSMDVQGNLYKYNCFLLPQFQIGNTFFKNTTICEDLDMFHINTTFGYSKKKNRFEKRILGSLGCPLLEKTSLFFDFPEGKIIFCKNTKQLKKLMINPNEWISVSFSKYKNSLIVVPVDSDLGKLNLLLDTGSSSTFLKKEFLEIAASKYNDSSIPYTYSNIFRIGTHDFSKKKLLFIDMQIEHVDGFLGMDFLKKIPFAIDYLNQKIYLKKNAARAH